MKENEYKVFHTRKDFAIILRRLVTSFIHGIQNHVDVFDWIANVYFMMTHFLLRVGGT